MFTKLIWSLLFWLSTTTQWFSQKAHFISAIKALQGCHRGRRADEHLFLEIALYGAGASPGCEEGRGEGTVFHVASCSHRFDGHTKLTFAIKAEPRFGDKVDCANWTALVPSFVRSSSLVVLSFLILEIRLLSLSSLSSSSSPLPRSLRSIRGRRFCPLTLHGTRAPSQQDTSTTRREKRPAIRPRVLASLPCSPFGL